MTTHSTQATGLYDPRYEHDACGVAFVARLDDEPSHEVVEMGLTALANLEHRGAAGADPLTRGPAVWSASPPGCGARPVAR